MHIFEIVIAGKLKWFVLLIAPLTTGIWESWKLRDQKISNVFVGLVFFISVFLLIILSYLMEMQIFP